ncbi:hypothetical protein DSM112329_04453 [Paraconexibacter sp. AEG42_29]|uniref:DUF4878 domain-containing protein n=1 Tax=Paraconexibacter sp. AEG42_29 TaxID=2997339 RepID=A0AAU7B0U0_9ACTN
MRHPRLIAALATTTLLLAACGSDSDEDKLTAIIKDGGKDPSTICDHLAPTLLTAFGTVKECKAKAKADDDKQDDVSIKSVVVDGTAATATISGSQGNQTVTFARPGSDWVITAIK